MMVAYPECFACRASLSVGHLAALSRHGCAMAGGTAWMGQMKNAVVRISILSGGRQVEKLQKWVWILVPYRRSPDVDNTHKQCTLKVHKTVFFEGLSHKLCMKGVHQDIVS